MNTLAKLSYLVRSAVQFLCGTSKHQITLCALAMIVAGSWSMTAQAYSTGIAGFSNNPSAGNVDYAGIYDPPAKCTSCHSDGAFPGYSATVSGSSTIAPGATGSYSMLLSYVSGAVASAGGLDVSVTSGTLVPGTGTHISSLANFDGRDGELIHDSPKSTSGGSVSWSFSYTAPNSVGTATLYGCANPVDNTGGSDGDGIARCDTLTVTINRTPNAVSDSWTVNKNSVNNSLTTALNNDTSGSSGNDSGDSISITSVGAASHGTATRINGTTIRYTPTAGYAGSDAFTYTITDSMGATDTATINVTVQNHAPVLGADSYSTNEDTTLNVAAAGVLANDTDSDGDTLTASVVSTTTHGALTLNSNGSFTYVPNANYFGPDSFTYQVSDGTTTVGPATVSITVNSINDAPVAIGDSYAASENVTLNVSAGSGVLANDSDVDSSITAVLNSTTTHGTLTLSSNGSFTYVPNAAYSGPDSFTYHAFDGALSSGIVTVSINVSHVAYAPVASADSYSTNEDTVLNVPASGVLSNDTDGNNDTLTAILDSTTSHGTLSLNANGSFSFTPTANYNGSDSFTYHAFDGGLSSGSVTVTITINAVNDAPTVVNDSYSTAEDTPLVVSASGVLANDSDIEGNTFTAAVVTNPAHGTVSLSSNGAFTYTPAANYNGADSFTYRATDNLGAASTAATVNITITPVNDAPVASNDSYSTNEDTTLNVSTSGVLANDSDVDNDPLTVSVVTNPTHGSLTLNANGSFSYVPAANYNGSDSFTYRANDGQANSNTATVNITIISVNDPPVANDDTYSINEDTTLTIGGGAGVLANDTDVENDPLTVSVVSTTTHGALTLNANGSFTYVPAANYNGTDAFTYRTNDGQANSNLAVVTITVNPVNDPPVAVAESYTTAEDTTLNVLVSNGLLANDTDVDNDPLSAVLVANVSHGTLTLNANGSFAYTPSANYNGTDTFTYHAYDGTAYSNTVTVTITITAVNDAPVAVNDTYATDEDITLNVDAATGVLANDTDAENDSLTVALVSTTSHGTLTLNANGSFTYVPVAHYRSTDSFTYRANDGKVNSTTAKVTITVRPVNHAPTAGNDGIYTAYKNQVLNIAATSGVILNDTDPDNDPLSAALVSPPAHGTLSLASDGGFSYMPNPNYLGSDQFTYRATDGSLTSSIATVSLVVVEPPPVITVPADIKINATGYLTPVNLTATATDSHDGTVPVTADTKSPLRPGHHVVTYTATNSAGLTAVATQNVDIVPLASLSADQITSRGRTVDVDFILNGPAVTYPVTLSYNVSGTATAADSNAVNGIVTITSGTRATLQIAIANDGGGAPDRTVIITLTNPTNAALGTAVSSTVTIVDRNVAPTVNVVATQLLQPRTRVYGTDGAVTIAAEGSDPDVGDTLTVDWTGTDAALHAPTTNTASFVICPVVTCASSTTTVPSGSYVVKVKATDSHGASDTRRWILLIGVTAPLLTTADSDLDHVNDMTEGVIDSWDTGLADYLNPFDESYVIPDQVGTGLTTHVLETSPGVSLHVGTTALAGGASGAMVVSPPADTGFNHASGVFDFELHGLQPGASATVVIPLQGILTSGNTYRELTAAGVWQSFNAADSISSAPMTNGACPGVNSSGWTTGLSSGAQCLRVTIADGGPNDADSVANGSILNTGGAASVAASSSSSSASSTGSKSGGGALGWPLLLTLAVVAGLIQLRRRRVQNIGD